MSEQPLDGPVSRRWPYLADAERAALRELLIHGPLSRAEIARRIDVSRASLTRATRVLIENALVVEGEIALRSGMGRPSELLVVREDAHHFLGVKLTGDAVFVVVTTLRAQVVAAVEEPLDSTDVAATVEQIGRIHDRLSADFDDIHAAGVCLAGDMAEVDGHQIVTFSYFLQWQDVPLADLLRARLGVPVTTDNDVRALTAVEHWFGAGAGTEALALLTVGAGIGVGLVIDDRIVTGRNGRAGALDHLLIDLDGPDCGRGHRGCASVFLPAESILSAIGVADLDYPGAVELARSGHPAAVRAFDEAGHTLGVLIATLLNAYDPEKVILTGEGLAVMELAGDRVRAAIARDRVPTERPVPLDVQPFEFTEWARAGAVLALRTALQF
ncbi:putative NBD/HSP70 family sugar kinase [Rathayibacter sp. PhB127]|uniref:ROK family transcriptional regulator n=1 Tax=Rathayibacter sp. PhB127 TaxID=2485176 RepID=UPI000FA78B76|nr:ROK family transcriptional regulator [Rathayibacter sp. PhB127]ROS21562.1 putative NBD/HSP70 family sugar kinase [Rathayibacter sp. PhB127]